MELMRPIAKIVNRYPFPVVIVVLVITALMAGVLATQGIETEFDESTFFPDNEVANANQEVEQEYGAVTRVQVVVKGRGGDVLTSPALAETLRAEALLAQDGQVNGSLKTPAQPAASIFSLADLMTEMSYLQFLGQHNLLQLEPVSYEQKLTVLVGGNLTIQGLNLSAYQANGTVEPVTANLSLPGMTTAQLKGFLAGLLNSSDPQLAPLAAQIPLLLTEDFDPLTMEAKATMVMVELNNTKREGESNFEWEQRLGNLEAHMRDLLKKQSYTSTEMGVVGEELMSKEITRASDESMGTLMPLVFGLVILILAFTFRNLLDTLLSILAMAMAVIWVYGLASLLGFAFTPMTTVVPIIVVGLGIDYSIHIVLRYREGLREGRPVKQAIHLTITLVGMALLLATLTTVTGFLSNVASPIGVLREFGIMVAMGILSSFLIMITFVPAVRQMVDTRRHPKVPIPDPSPIKGAKKGPNQGQALERFLAQGALAAEHHPRTVLATLAVLTLVMGGSALQLETTFGIEDFLPPDLEISEHMLYMLDNFNVSREESYILVKGNLTNPAVLQALNSTLANMADDRHVEKLAGRPRAESVLSLMADYANDSATPTSQDPRYNTTFAELFETSGGSLDGVPDTNLKGLYDWLYTNARDEAIPLLHRNRDGEYDGAVVRVRVDSQALSKAQELIDELEADTVPLERLESQGVLEQVTVTGGPIVMHVVLDSMNRSMLNSLVITIIVSMVMLTIVFWLTAKSRILGLITTVPVLLVMVWILGTMWWLGISLNLMTIMIAALTIGLGITYAIHITHRFVEEWQEHHDVERAVRRTVVHTGTALFGAAATTIGGFGVLAFSVLPPMQDFGLITAITILYSFLASVLVLPTLLALWARQVRQGDVAAAPRAAEPEPKAPWSEGVEGEEAEESEVANEGPVTGEEPAAEDGGSGAGKEKSVSEESEDET